MNLHSIENLYLCLGSESTGIRNHKWVQGHCPLGTWNHGGKDNNPSFAIEMNSGKCKCFSCGFGGDVWDLVFEISRLNKRKPNPQLKLDKAWGIVQGVDGVEVESDFLGNIPDYKDGYKYEVKSDIIFPQEWLDTFKPYYMFKDACLYLKSRGISKELADFFQIKYDFTRKRVGFPFYNRKGELIGMQSRDIQPNSEFRHLQYGYQDQYNPSAWFGENLVDFSKPVILLEGVFDYLSVYRVYKNVMASFTSALSYEKCCRVELAESIITFYDYGKGGDFAREKLARTFTKIPVNHLIPTKEQDDAGNMTEEEVEVALSSLLNLNIGV